MFVVFEGIDGSGKTTYAKMLVKYFNSKGIKSIFTKEPTNGRAGKLVRRALRGEEYFRVSDSAARMRAIQMLFALDREQHVSNFIKRRQAAGYVIVSDRYLMSTIAYGVASGIQRRLLVELNRAFPRPDLTVFIDISPNEAIRRISGRHARAANGGPLFEKRKVLAKVHREYERILKAEGDYVLVDGNGTKEEVSKRVLAIVSKRIKYRTRYR